MAAVAEYTDGGVSIVMSRTGPREWLVELWQDGRLTFGQYYGSKRQAAEAVRRITRARRMI